MANRTQKDAKSVRGTNPQYLVEKIIRTRAYDTRYWKEECFALTAELVVDKGMEMRFIGGTYGGNLKVTPFMCLLLKMLQIQPDRDIIIEFIKQEEFKYLRCVGALYVRLTMNSVDCYKYLEPLYNDFRKIRKMNRMGLFELLHIDEFIDQLLNEERVCDIQLPRIQRRHVLEETGELEARRSALDEDLENMTSSDEEVKIAKKKGEAITNKDGERKKKKRKPEGLGIKRVRETSEEREIRESNELRAKLGLPALKVGVMGTGTFSIGGVGGTDKA